MLTTAWCEGRTFDELLATATQEERNRLGRALYEFYIGSLYRHGVFNADPHPGNLLFPAAGGVVVLDHGCVREFDRPTVAAIAALSRAVRDDDGDAMLLALGQLGARATKAGLAPTMQLLRGFFQPVLEPGVRRVRADVTLEAREVVKHKLAVLSMRLPGKLLFLFRIRFGLHSVLARLGAELDWRALEAELADGPGGGGTAGDGKAAPHR